MFPAPRIFGERGEVKSSAVAMRSAVLAFLLLACGVCLAGERPMTGLALARGRIAAESRQTGAGRPLDADRIIREGIEWHTGRLLFEAEGSRTSPPARDQAVSLLVLSWAAPGQRFYRSDRALAALASLIKQAVEPAAGAEPSPAGSGLAGRQTSQALVGALFCAGEAMDGASRAAVERELERLGSRVHGRGPAERSWRARARLALSVWRHDAAGARQALDDALDALAETDGPYLAGRPETLSEKALCAADALAVLAWTKGTGLTARPEAEAGAVRGFEDFVRWMWLDGAVDPLLAPGRLELEALECAAVESALRCGLAPADLMRSCLESWGERGDGWPGPAALTLARLPSAGAEGVRPWEDRLNRGWAASPEGSLVVAKTQRGPAGFTTFRACDEGLCAQTAEPGLFNVYSGARAALLRRPELAGLWPGSLVSPGSEGGGNRMGDVGWRSLASGAAGVVAAGEAPQARRMTSAGPGGLAVSCVVTRTGASGGAAGAWRCVPGRDTQAWIEIEWPGVVSFDTVRVTFRPGRGDWRGVAREMRAQVSTDRVSWAFGRAVAVPRAAREAPPDALPVVSAMDRVNARYLRVTFGDGGIGGFVRVSSIEVFKTTRGERGEILEEGPNLALASLGAKATAESSASAEEGAERVIGGGAASVGRAPARMALAVAPAGVTVAWGHAGETRWTLLPEAWGRLRLEGVEWLWDGQAGYVLSAPVAVIAERAGAGLWSLQIEMSENGVGLVAMPMTPMEEAAASSREKRYRWLKLSPEAVWMEDAESGAGFVAVFDAVRSGGMTSDGRMAAVYIREGGKARAWGANPFAPARLSLDVPGVGAITVTAQPR